ncbi:MAG: hypothetical protein R3C39_02805 [Dehalococcoidia bacterium]
MSTLFALFVTLWGLVGTQIDVRHVDGAVKFTDLYGNAREAEAALGCPSDGAPIMWLGTGVRLETIVHELAHAYDCLDDGLMNASPINGARPATRPAWVSDYCWDTDAEWYACWVVHSGSIDASPASMTARLGGAIRGWLAGPPR